MPEKKYCIIHQKKIMPILTAMQPLCTKRTTVDTTAQILFYISNRELVLKATDLEISLQSSCPLEESSFAEAEQFLVPGRRIFELLKELEGPITFFWETSHVSIQAEGVEVHLHIQPAEEFPSFPERIENLLGVPRGELLDLVERVSFLIPQNNSNPALNGLFAEISPAGFSLTATNGHCLVRVHNAAYMLETARSWVLPRRAVFELKKLLENSNDATVFLGVCDGHVVFSGEQFNFFTRLISQQFPEYRPILQREGFEKGTIDKTIFTKALRRSACLLTGQFIATQFSFDKHSVRLTLQNKGVGTVDEVVPLESFTGEPFAIRFYAPYLLDGLQVFSENPIPFYVKDGARPMVLATEPTEKSKTSVTFLVMPISPATRA